MRYYTKDGRLEIFFGRQFRVSISGHMKCNCDWLELAVCDRGATDAIRPLPASQLDLKLTFNVPALQRACRRPRIRLEAVSECLGITPCALMECFDFRRALPELPQTTAFDCLLHQSRGLGLFDELVNIGDDVRRYSHLPTARSDKRGCATGPGGDNLNYKYLSQLI